MDAMPSPWPLASLGELCRIELGSTPPRKSGAMWDSEKSTNNVWLTIADLPKSLNASAFDSKEYVSDLAAANMRKIPAGTLLVSFKLTLGRLGYAGIDLFSNEAIASLLDIDESKVQKRFLYWALSAFDWDKAAEGDQKIKGKTLNKAKLKRIPISLPPLEEQRRIVAVLDEAFEGLDRAHAHIEANLRQSKEVFDEAISKCFQNIPENSNLSTLGKIATFRNGLNFTRTSQGEQVRVVGVGDFKDNFDVPIYEIGTARINGSLDENDRLKRGDVLVVRSNGNRQLIGRTMLVPEIDEPTSFSGFTIRIRLESGCVLPEYLCSYMRTKEARKRLTAGGGGTNISNLNQRLLSSFPIMFPNTDGQLEVLSQVEHFQSKKVEIDQRYSSTLTDLGDLRQSLLQRAFAGELT